MDLIIVLTMKEQGYSLSHLLGIPLLLLQIEGVMFDIVGSLS